MKTTKCKWPKCMSEARRGMAGWCSFHYRKRHAMGLTKMTDCAPVKAHIVKLRELGWTYDQIAENCPCNGETVRMMLTQDYKKVHPPIGHAILSLPLVARDSTRQTDDLTVMWRQLDAMAFMGWPQHVVCKMAGITPTRIKDARDRGTTSFSTIYAIDEVFRKVAYRQGPSERTRTLARGRGCVSVMAWNDIYDLNEPKPKLEKPPAAKKRISRIPWDDVQHLRSLGLDDEEIAKKIGVRPSTLRDSRRHKEV